MAFGAPLSYETAIGLDDHGAVVSGRIDVPYRLTVHEVDLAFALEPGAATVAGAFGDFVVAGIDQSGQPVRFVRGAGGTWSAARELSVGASDRPGVGSGALIDPESGWRMAFTDGEGDLWVTSTFRNLSEDDPPLEGNVVVVRDWRRAIGAIARDAAGDLRAYRILRGAQDSVVFPKEPINISADSLRRHEGRAPVLVGDIEVFTTAWNSIHIVGLDAAGQVWSVWTAPAFNGRWTASNISAKVGAPALTGDLGVIVTPWGGLQISGTDAAGSTVALWWSPALRPGNWRAVNLTQAIGGPAFRAGTIGAVLTARNALGVFGVRQDTGELAVYWWAPGMAGWEASTVGGVDVAQSGSLSGPISTAIGRLGEQHVAVTTDTGHLVHALWEPGMRGWLVEDVTLLLSE